MSSTDAASHSFGYTGADLLEARAVASGTGRGGAAAEPVIIVSSDLPIELIIPTSACTFDGFRRWALSDEFPRGGRLSYIGDAIFLDMSPESFEEQGAIKTEVCRVLAQLVRDRELGYLRIDRTLISNKAARLSSEPDGVFVSSATLRSGRVKLVPEIGRATCSKELVGSVDWVMEIVSRASRTKDAQVLRDIYFSAGIPEYWLIDPLVEDDEPINFKILVAGPAGYLEVEPQEGWMASPTFQRLFQLNRKRDADDFWQYTLDAKENQ